ncbi:MAG: phosphopantothenoylcysteine decarboxylase [Chthoniobacterales bacterium]|jgi:phosphopantothenoylcysteine synthetase/decarboxylase
MSKPLAIVTAGPASAPIDEVRRLTNFATGEIGALLAGALLERGFEVLIFRGRGATHTEVPPGAQLQEFTANRELGTALEEVAEIRTTKVRAVFHAAALSDYSVASVLGPDGDTVRDAKIRSDWSEVRIILQPAAKILPRLRGWFPHAWIAGWKYEVDGARTKALEQAREQLLQGRTDATIVNGAAYGSGYGVLEGTNPPLHCATKRELADFLASRASNPAKARE